MAIKVNLGGANDVMRMSHKENWKSGQMKNCKTMSVTTLRDVLWGMQTQEETALTLGGMKYSQHHFISEAPPPSPSHLAALYL